MSLILFKIGNTDLTQYVDIQNYDVNNTPEYMEWTDANHIRHRDVIRTRLSGTVKLGFLGSTDVAAFLSVLSSNITAGGYYPASVFSNDDNTLHTGVQIFIDDVADIKRDLVNNRSWHAYELKIEER